MSEPGGLTGPDISGAAPGGAIGREVTGIPDLGGAALGDVAEPDAAGSGFQPPQFSFSTSFGGTCRKPATGGEVSATPELASTEAEAVAR